METLGEIEIKIKLSQINIIFTGKAVVLKIYPFQLY